MIVLCLMFEWIFLATEDKVSKVSSSKGEDPKGDTLKDDVSHTLGNPLTIGEDQMG